VRLLVGRLTTGLVLSLLATGPPAGAIAGASVDARAAPADAGAADRDVDGVLSGEGVLRDAASAEPGPMPAAQSEETVALNAAEPAAEGTVTPRKKRRVGVVARPRGAQPDEWTMGIDVATRALGGYMNGLGVRSVSTAVVATSAHLEPHLERWGFSAALPVDFAHRQTFGPSLDETRGRATVEFGWRRGPSLRLAAFVGLAVTHRPGWSDLYQPVPTGGYVPTDRFSHLDRAAGLKLAGIPLRHLHARLEFDWERSDYATDPTFLALARPDHLTPWDGERHKVESSWRYLASSWRVGLGADAFLRRYFFRFARDAGSGSTHAAPGGPSPNPLLVLRGVEPGASGEVAFFDGRLELKAAWGIEIVQDTYQGYYSYVGHHPVLRLEASLPAGIKLQVRGDGRWARYGPASYQAGAGHPPLLWGDRRANHRLDLEVTVRIPLPGAWAARVEVAAARRRTNFPTYEPGILPASSDYDIDWNYDNFLALAGLEWGGK
jgi:hypothetical protein